MEARSAGKRVSDQKTCLRKNPRIRAVQVVYFILFLNPHMILPQVLRTN